MVIFCRGFLLGFTEKSVASVFQLWETFVKRFMVSDSFFDAALLVLFNAICGHAMEHKIVI